MLARLTSWDVTVPSKAYDPAYMCSSGSNLNHRLFLPCDDESHMLFSLLSLVCIEPPPVTYSTLLDLGLAHHTSSGMIERHTYMCRVHAMLETTRDGVNA